jgi:hypothetical protein
MKPTFLWERHLTAMVLWLEATSTEKQTLQFGRRSAPQQAFKNS